MNEEIIYCQHCGKQLLTINNVCENPDCDKYITICLKYNKKLEKIQKSLSRKKNGSKNSDKIQLKIDKTKRKISNVNKDFINKHGKL